MIHFSIKLNLTLFFAFLAKPISSDRSNSSSNFANLISSDSNFHKAGALSAINQDND